MAEDALRESADPDGLSVFGLSHWLSELQRLLQRAEHALASKAPRPEDSAIAECKEELLEAQARLRRAVGARLEEPSLTARERPLAEDFLQGQIARLGDGGGAKAKALERLREMLAGVRAAAPVPESRRVRDLEASIRQLEAEWKEVSPLHDKWQAGKHTFKSTADLQAFKRRYEECRKGREASAERLQAALRAARTGDVAEEPEGLPPGWSAVAQRPAPKVQSRAAPRPAAPRQNRWGATVVSFAQRLRAEAVASVRDEVEAQRAEQADEEEEPAPVVPGPTPTRQPPRPPPRQPPPPPIPVRAKGPPPLPPGIGGPPSGAAPARLGQDTAAPACADSDVEEEEPDAQVSTTATSGSSAAAKKKGKAKRRRPAREEEEPCEPVAAPPRAQAPGWLISAQASLSGSLLQELLSQGAWAVPEDAEARLAMLCQRLPWASPLGLRLPLEWRDFVGLQVDGGPRRTSKRGTSPWVVRLQRNVPWLTAHYVMLLFFLTLLHALSHFGLLLWAAAAQAALILAPPELQQLRAPMRVVMLQAVHLLLWALFVRSLWQMHLLVKLPLAALVVGHAYAVKGVSDN